MKYIKVFICSLLFIFVFHIHDVYALEIIKTDSVHSTIPLNYHFAPRFINEKTTVELCSIPSQYQWKVVDGFYQLQNKQGKAVSPPSELKGKLYVIYHHVGYYQEQAVDMKITLMNYSSNAKRVEFGKTYIGFGNPSSTVGGSDDYIEAKIEYYYAQTTRLVTDLKGHQPVGDLDCFINGQSEWLKLGTNTLSSIIIPHSTSHQFDLSKINQQMIGAKQGNGGTKNTDGLNFVYLFNSPSHTIKWYGAFLRMNMYCPDQEFQLNFYGGDAKGSMSPQVINYRIDTAIKKCTFEKEGYHFNGWHAYRDYDDSYAYKQGSYWQKGLTTCENLRHYEDEEIVSTLAPCGNIYMYACFKANQYQIEFNANGGKGSMPVCQLNYDESMELPQNHFEKEGYVFAGWALSEDGNVLYEDQETIINLTNKHDDVIILYAKWHALPIINSKTHYYYIDETVSKNQLLNNASAYDEIDGNLSSQIQIQQIIYPAYTDYNPSSLDTSKEGIAYITYTVSNSYQLSSSTTSAIYIISKEAQTTTTNSLLIYPRYISNLICSDGLYALDTLSYQSIWQNDDYYLLLNQSLSKDKDDYLKEYDYIND